MDIPDELKHAIEKTRKETDQFKDSLLKPVKKAKPRQKMGIGKLGDASAIFVRKFRWTIEGTGLVHHFVKTVKLDLHNKEIHIELYEVACTGDLDINTLEWADSLGKVGQSKNEQELVLTTFDGCGTAIYKYCFKNLRLIKRQVSFDYADSDTTTHDVIVKYVDCSRQYVFNEENEEKVEPSFFWTARLSDQDHKTPEVEIDLENRPTLNVEEEELDFLNTKIWIPGKCKWEKLKIKLSMGARSQFLRELIDGSYQNLILYFYKGISLSYGPIELMETWVLEHVRVSNILDIDEEFCTLQVRYNGVRYEPKPKHIEEALVQHDKQRKREHQHGQSHL